ncbi:MAG: hypothetical protein ACYC0X_09755 [Pirellulaceae bacterium]
MKRSFPLLVASLTWLTVSNADSAQPAPKLTEDLPWYQRSIVGMEVGPTGAQFGYSEKTELKYASRFNGRDIVQKCFEAEAEYLVIWARDGDWAYYNSKIADKCPGLGERDVLRETVDEAARHQLPVIAYCVVQQAGNFLASHPEFQAIDAAGKPIARFCYNSGYLDVVKNLIAEQLAYGINGFHIDMLDQGFGPPYGCWCEHCRQAFQAQYGRAMPSGVTWDDDWDRMLEFRYATSARFEKELTAHIRAIQPAASVDFNYHGNPPFSWEVGQRPVQHAGNSDFVTGETGVWGFSALTVGLNAQFYRAAFPGHPYQVAINRGVRIYHDQTTRPLNDMRWETLTLLSHGAFVTMIDKTAYDGGLDPVAYLRIGDALREARAKRAHFGQPPVREVGLYFSARTRDWVARENPATYFQSFQGAHKACVLEHIPFGVLLDEHVTVEMMREYPVVCLANIGIVSERELTVLRDYVVQGGHLLITGQSGQYGALGQPLANTSLSELIGANVVRRLDSADNWIRFPTLHEQAAKQHPQRRAWADQLQDKLPSDWPFLVEGPATVYQPTAAVSIGELLAPHRMPSQLRGELVTDWPLSADQPVGPAILVNKVGEGTVVTFAASPDFATASEHHLVETRQLFRRAVRLLHPDPVVKIAAPANVEVVVTDDAEQRTLRIHLIAYNPTPQTTPAKNRPYILPGLVEDRPMYRASIESARPITGARALSETTVMERTGSRLDLIVDDIHDVVLIQY